MRFLVLPLLLVGASVNAQDSNGVSFTLGLGGAFTPDYFGSENSSFGSTGSFSPQSFQLGPLSFGQGGSDASGFGVTGSLRYIGAREAAENPELTGLNDIDAALEVGGGVRYATDIAEIYAIGRYGVVGHEALVGEIGGDLIMQPNAQTEMRIGPRLFFGDDAYAATYFGVDASETGFQTFDANGGLLSRGIEASIAYNITDDWGVVGTINYDELLNDAAQSPIVQTTDQLGVSLVVTRKVSWSF